MKHLACSIEATHIQQCYIVSRNYTKLCPTVLQGNLLCTTFSPINCSCAEIPAVKSNLSGTFFHYILSSSNCSVILQHSRAATAHMATVTWPRAPRANLWQWRTKHLAKVSEYIQDHIHTPFTEDLRRHDKAVRESMLEKNLGSSRPNVSLSLPL